MAPERPRSRRSREGSARRGAFRPGPALLAAALALAQVPVASAHGATAAGGLSQWHGVLLVAVGVVLLGGASLLKRTGRLSPSNALSGVFAGIAVIALGAILFEGVAPEPTYSARSMPFPRTWYPMLASTIGLLVATLSFVVGWRRWPERPRYALFGIVMGFWISYPYLVGPASETHPLGYALVLATPAFVGYILWKDAWDALRTILRDPVARRFGIGVGALVGLFFMTSSGYLSFFREEGVPHEAAVAVLPVNYQLVMWPTLEVALPHVPLFFAVSVGILAVVGTLSVLVGLNASLVARRWRVEERAGMVEGTAGTAAVVGTCTCGCCGPLVAKIAVVAAGPAIAAPLYWVFVDAASPLGALFIVGSLGLFTGSLLYSLESTREQGRAAAIGPTD